MPPEVAQGTSLPSIENIGLGEIDDDLKHLPPGYTQGEEGEGGEEGAEAEESPEGEEGEGEGEEGQEEGEEGEEDPELGRVVKYKNEDGTEVEAKYGDLITAHREYGKLDAAAQKLHAEYMQVGQKAHQAIEKNRTEYTGSLQKFSDWIMATVMPEFQNLDMERLAAEDPAAYNRVQARIGKINGVLQRIQQEQETTAERSQAEGAHARAAAVQQSQKILSQAIPGWSNEKYSTILTSAVKHYGFDMKEIGNVIDPRLIKMAHDAAEYNRLKSGKPLAGKKVSTKPLPVTRPGQGRVSSGPKGKVNQARVNLKRSGSDADALALLTSKGIG